MRLFAQKCVSLWRVNLAQLFSVPPLDRSALVVSGRTTSYGQLVERVGAWRGALSASGLEPGDRVGLLSGNDEVFVFGYLACLTAGLVTVPLNPQSPPAELRRQMQAVDARAVIVGTQGRSVWSELTDLAGTDVPQSFEVGPIDSSLSVLPSLLIEALDGGTSIPMVEVPKDSPAIFLFTSGTAGDPKPAVLTHQNLATSIQSVMTVNPDFFAQEQRVLAIIPLFHVFGINLILNLGLVSGATLVLEDHVGPARTAELVRINNVSILAGPPTLWASLLRDDSISKTDFASVELAISGAARLEPVLAVQLEEVLGVSVNEGYGLSETCGVLTSSMGTDAPVGSVGPLMPGVEARLVDLEGDNVLVGDVGEVWMRGPMLSPGYWERDGNGGGEAIPSSQTTDGWLRTGDLAVVDDFGNLAIMSRIKDLIIVSGFNVHPAEVETALSSHPSVSAAGVKGEPDDMTGERIVAYVVAKKGHRVDPDVLRAHCGTELARYKVPVRIEPVLELPISTIGKLRRKDL